MNEEIKTVPKNNDPIYYNKTKATPVTPPEIGVDLNNSMLYNIANAGVAGVLDLSMIDGFTRLTDRRDQLYELLDTMYEDSIIGAVLRSYCEDATERNDNGQIVWAESEDSDIATFVNFLLKSMSVDKNIYSWADCLVRYGDVYLRLYRQSDIDKFNNIFNKEKSTLNEEVYVKAYSKDDHFVDYVKKEPNPAEFFELVKFGQSQAYIQAESAMTRTYQDTPTIPEFHYKFKRGDITIFDARTFVHGCLEDNSHRIEEEVDIYTDNQDIDKDETEFTYEVRRGKGLLYNAYKAWREYTLMKTSLLLNRLTKSSITRVVQVEVGDMPKEQVQPHMMNIKALMEQKAAYNTNQSMSEYTNPGPIENTVYIATHGGIGTISSTTMGGDIDVKGISDIDFFRQQLFGSMSIPSQYFGFTDDAAGFSGGQSLAIISSQYGKAVKRVQSVLSQMTTDLVNIKLLDKGLDSYINKFVIKMKAPVTQAEIDERDNITSKVQMISDIMNVLGDIEDIPTKLNIAKSMLAEVVHNQETLSILQDYIKKLVEESKSNASGEPMEEESEDFGGSRRLGGGRGSSSPRGMSDNTPNEDNELNFELPSLEDNESPSAQMSSEPTSTLSSEGGETILPTGNDLGIDLTSGSEL